MPPKKFVKKKLKGKSVQDARDVEDDDEEQQQVAATSSQKKPSVDDDAADDASLRKSVSSAAQNSSALVKKQGLGTAVRVAHDSNLSFKLEEFDTGFDADIFVEKLSKAVRHSNTEGAFDPKPMQVQGKKKKERKKERKKEKEKEKRICVGFGK